MEPQQKGSKNENGINNVDLKVLLGDNNQTQDIDRLIRKQLVIFLTTTNKIGVL
jgi:hypothetical protein